MKDVYRAPTRTVGDGARAGLLAAAIAMAVPCLFMSTPCFAEVHDPLRGYGLDGTPVAGGAPEPRERDTPVREGRPGPAYVSASRIRRIAARQGLRLTSLPRRHGRAYFATAVNGAGHTMQLMFNAFNGDIVAQKDLSPPTQTAVAAPAPVADSKPTEAGPAAVDPIAQAAAADAANPVVDEVAAARAEADKAAAETEARKTAQAAAGEARQAKLKLAEAEAAARKTAQMKAADEHRAQVKLAEAHRNELKLADAKRKTLAVAEARLAQAKAAKARIDADLNQAEAQAAEARAAMAPVEMTKDVSKPADMTPVDATASTDAAGVKPKSEAAMPADKSDSAASATPKAESTDGQTPPVDAAKNADPTPAAAPPADTAKTDDNNTGTGKTEGGTDVSKTDGSTDASKADNGQADGDKGAAAEASPPTDMSPTGSMSNAPPEPYHAPTPDEAAAAEKN